MNPTLKYTLGRLGIFAACAIPAILLLTSLDVLVRIMIALVASAGISYFALRRWRDEVSERLADSARRRTEQRQQFRSALAGDASAGSTAGPSDASSDGSEDGDGTRER